VQRLQGRGTDTAEQVAARLRTAQGELKAVEEFDYAVVNDDLERCVADLRRIVAAERAGTAAELRRRFAPKAAAARLRENSA
jgi:guanylate kinase